MDKYLAKNGVYIKSNNSVKKIYDSYTTSLIIFIILTIISNLIIKNNAFVLSLLKTILISLVATSIFSYIINVIKKENDFLKIYTDDNIHIIALLLALFGVNSEIYILLIAIFILLIVKYTVKKVNLSCVLYGILIIILAKYFMGDLVTPLTKLQESKFLLTYPELLDIGNGIGNYLFGFIYLSPIFSIISFIYLYHKKAIKYNLVLSYILTVFIVMLSIGLLHNFNYWFGIFELFTGNILFLTVFTLTDYMVSPTTREGQIIYGIILGIISSILRFIIPELAMIIVFILGEVCLTKYIDNVSPKFKYNQKKYYTLITILCIISLVTIIIIANVI